MWVWVLFYTTQTTKYAGMAELADALDSGSNSCKAVQVQVLLPAPKIDIHQQMGVDFFVMSGLNSAEKSPMLLVSIGDKFYLFISIRMNSPP